MDYLTGDMRPFIGEPENVPDDYLPCLGEAVSRSENDELFKMIGCLYGPGDGETTFNLPKLGHSVYDPEGKGYEYFYVIKK
jgi:microcystin-dependent protein